MQKGKSPWMASRQELFQTQALFGIILLTQPWSRLSWTQSSLATFWSVSRCWEKVSVEGLQVSLETPQGSCHHGLWMRGRTGKIQGGRSSEGATAKEVLSKWQSRKMLCTAFCTGDEHTAAQFVKGSEKVLQSCWVRGQVGDLAVWMAAKSPLGQRVRERQSSGLTQPKYTDPARRFHDKPLLWFVCAFRLEQEAGWWCCPGQSKKGVL